MNITDKYYLNHTFLIFKNQIHSPYYLNDATKMQHFVTHIVVVFYQQIAINGFLLFTTQLNP